MTFDKEGGLRCFFVVDHWSSLWFLKFNYFLDIIRDSNERGEIYVAEPHVRDKLIPPSKRFSLWFIKELFMKNWQLLFCADQ